MGSSVGSASAAEPGTSNGTVWSNEPDACTTCNGFAAVQDDRLKLKSPDALTIPRAVRQLRETLKASLPRVRIEVVAQLRATGHAVLDDDLARVSPLLHAHITPNGSYFQSPRPQAASATELAPV